MKVYSPDELNALPLPERKIALGGEFGRSFHVRAAECVTWIVWAQDTQGPAKALSHASAFMLDRGQGPILVTAAHVYRQYLEDRRRYGALRCQVANTTSRDLSVHLIDCGNLGVPLDEPDCEPDIATFRLPDGAAGRIGKTPILAAPGSWPSAPKPGEQVMIAGYPAQERIMFESGEMDMGFYSGMLPATTVTEHQISLRLEREFMLDHHGTGLPPLGYGMGGISGGPLLVPYWKDDAWIWRLGGVISQATEERPPEEVITEMIVAHRAEYILDDGTLAKIL